MVFPTTITLTSNSNYGPPTLDTTSSTPTSKIYGISTTGGFIANIEFFESNGSTKVYVNPTVGGAGTPDKVKINGGSLVESAIIVDGDTVTTWETSSSLAIYEFVVDTSGTNNLIFSSGSGPVFHSTSTSSSNKKVFCNFW